MHVRNESIYSIYDQWLFGNGNPVFINITGRC